MVPRCDICHEVLETPRVLAGVCMLCEIRTTAEERQRTGKPAAGVLDAA